MQTLKMLLVGSEKPGVHQRCAIASELLDELGKIPLGLFRATSTTSVGHSTRSNSKRNADLFKLHHLAHIGYLLGSVVQKSLPAWTYMQIHNILLVLAAFLEKIEASRISAPGLAIELRAHISRIDRYMQTAPNRDQDSQISSDHQSTLAGSLHDVSIASLGSLSVSNPQYVQTIALETIHLLPPH